ncbi:MAG TPA: gephyrin-like molybdotransferase receptor GlpR [Amycolatopsis sp.]|uniref:divisome protein SepX/GlpR n=1 Tax=Amycolatopsis sp. TaxID=37632 RepID=UPI002B480F33|nr:gephyrin-like molybdotransferase receptor GlpR [Amycolatopsis sp.]HKS44147.1 gephyrin-like molybdotransferase receptor GlpR [Amycolatopsis sp.]
MPSSLIIFALAAAWLAVLVPMVARKRQAVARTADTELAARVVRSAEDEEFGAAEHADEVTEPEVAHDEESPPSERRYRPGRGGFDPEAAEIAARAKYAFRQHVVLTLMILAVATAVAGGFFVTELWWAHGAVDAVLVGYLAYLRRQVRIETEIRQRRLARLKSARARRPAPPTFQAEPESEEARLPVVESMPPPPRAQGGAVVVDVEDEDPEFHELDDPAQLPFRRAVGE